MPGCSVIGCKNRSEHGYRMFLLPQGERNEDRRKLWVMNIGRPNLPNKSVVCEAHFTSDQFENKRLDNKRLLKWNAVPTIFPVLAPDSNKRTRKVTKKLPEKSNCNNETTSNEPNTNSVSMPDSDSCNTENSTSANVNDSSPCLKRSTRKRKIKFNVNDIYSSNIDKTLLEGCHEPTKKSVKSPSNFRKKKTVGNKTCSRLENFAEVISTKTTPKRLKFAESSDKGPPFSTKVVRVSTENICRLCGKLSDALVPVFYSGNDTEEEDIPSLINTLLPIKISAEDVGWPKNVCEICLNNLAEWNKMYIKSKEVDSAFRKILNKPTETSNNFDIEVPIISLIGHDYCPTYMSHPALDKNDASCTSSEEENLDVMSEEDTDKLLMSVDVGEEEGDDVDDYDKENESLQHSKAKPIEKSNSGKQYKIGITLVKNKDCNEDAALNLNSLKSILVTKVNQLFQSICNDETIGKSLVNRSEDHDDDDDDDTSDAEWNDVTNRYSGNNLGVLKSNVLKQASHKKQNVISRVSSISKRMESFNKHDGPYLCSKCGHVSLRRRAYLKHLRLFHVERKCNYCDAMLPSSSDYKKHLRLMHYEKISINRCEICDTTFIKKERLERHKLIIHNIGEYHHCDICNRKCASKQQLHSHKNDVHRKQENLCQECGRMFPSYRKMLTHWKIFHSPQSNVAQKNFYCSICNRQFKRSGALAIHNFTMHNIEYDRSTITRLSKSVANTTFSCLICNVRITDMELLKQHMDYHMNDEEVRKLSGNDVGKIKCLLCNKYFEKEKDLGLHRYFYHKEMPFVCSTDGCLSSFWKKTALVVHQLSEHKTRSYSCTMCSETFEDFRIKRRHMIKNHPGSSNTKTFSCNVCNKQFNTKYSLNVHMVMHSDEREHKCVYCGKEFKLKFTLSRHLQHHEKNDYLVEDNVTVKKRNSIRVRTFDLVRSQTNIPNAVNETSELIIENNGTIVQNLPVLSGIPTKPITIEVVKK